MYQFGRHGREGLCDLTKSSYLIKLDAKGRNYVKMTYSEADKTHYILDSRETAKKPRMYATGDEQCPVASLSFTHQSSTPTVMNSSKGLSQKWNLIDHGLQRKLLA